MTTPTAPVSVAADYVVSDGEYYKIAASAAHVDVLKAQLETLTVKQELLTLKLADAERQTREAETALYRHIEADGMFVYDEIRVDETNRIVKRRFSPLYLQSTMKDE